MILGIDHVLIAVEDLDKAMNLYGRLGFQVLRGGEHPQAGTSNALVTLADGSYLELIAVTNPPLGRQFPFSKQVVGALGRTNRIAGFSLETNDYNNDVQAIRNRGLAISKAAPGERFRSDGQRVSWWTAHPEDPRLPFLIQDLASRALRVPSPSEGIGRSTHMGWIEIGAADLQPVTTAYAQLLGERPVEGRFPLQRGAINLSQSLSVDGVQMVALLTPDLAGLAREWQAHDVPFYDEGIRGAGRVLVPRDTGGVRISFCQAR